jgi:transcriptional regulator with PAS, ATPase and Fis domain
MNESTTQTATATFDRNETGDTRTQPQLFVLLERARPLAGGARHSLANIDEVLVGRGNERRAWRTIEDGRRVLHVCLPDMRISAVHARLERVGGEWTASDCRSTNGMRINGERADRAILSDRDVLELGQTILRFRQAMATPANAPGDVDASEAAGLSRCLATLSPRLTHDLQKLERLARSNVSVLLEGETGTGKELLARAIHAESRRPGPFVAVNCGALPQGLAESLLFGHKKGAFSGATSHELGFARAAQGGTLFLDEIGDLPANSQAVLLRVLQEREVVPLGATRPVPLDVRVVAATHKSLTAAMPTGAFRQDLLARVAQFTFTLPPLRDRADDIGMLVAAVLTRMQVENATSLTVGANAARELLTYDWPANVRELEQRLKVGVLLATAGRIEFDPVPGECQARSTEPPSELSSADAGLRAQLLAEIEQHRGNLTQVAATMSTSRRQVQRWIRRFAIDARMFRG